MSENVSRRTFVAAAAGTAALAASSSAVALADNLAGVADGTYTATRPGIGDVTVTVVVENGSITDAQVDVSGETNFIGAQFGDLYASSILDAQGTEFDTTTGATITCDAVKRAVADCIAQAKGEQAPASSVVDDATDADWLGNEPEIDEVAVTETWDTDILIVGAGNGGLTAAAYAAKNGLNFRCIEKYSSPQDVRGWYGVVDSADATAAGAATMDRKKLLSEISRYASGKCNQRVVKMWMDESADMQAFVSSILTADPYNASVAVTTGEEASWPAECAQENTDYMFPEMEHFWNASDPTQRVQRLGIFAEVCEEAGTPVDYNTGMVKLEKDADGRVTGVIAQDQEDYHLIRINAAKGVLLACGGYAGNPRMMLQLDPLGTAVTTAASYSPRTHGDGIRAAVWAGADMDQEGAPMLFDRGIVEPGVNGGYIENAKAFGGREFPGTLKQFNPGSQPFLKVNRDGERFMNESQPYNDASFAAYNQPGHVYCMVFDGNAQADVERFHTIGCSAGTRKMGIENAMSQQLESGLVKQADTLEELADALGFAGEAKEAFLATCDRYNALYDAQEDEDFGKASVRLSELRTAPFYGCWLGASLLTTIQGVKINEKTQAMDKNAQPIEGLYVCGDNSGSFFANNYPCLMPGIACGRTMTEAIKAVKQMGGLE